MSIPQPKSFVNNDNINDKNSKNEDDKRFSLFIKDEDISNEMDIIDDISDTDINTYDKYQKVTVIGQGTYGVVHKALDLEHGDEVAIKKVRVENIHEGVSIGALREIKFLTELDHVNIIGLRDIFAKKNNINLVFELMDGDLKNLLSDGTVNLSIGDIKGYMLQVFQGLAYLHSNWIIHRDLKPDNLLINRYGEVKITDFGLSRIYPPPEGAKLTDKVFVKFYRAPELLFGETQYGSNVDMWAAGCILAQFLLRRILFEGNTDLEQLKLIFTLLGTPNEERWPGVTSLPDYISWKEKQPVSFKEQFPDWSDDTIEIVKGLLTLNPAKRWSAERALKSDWFVKEPLPVKPTSLPLPLKLQYLVDHDTPRQNRILPGAARLAKMTPKALFQTPKSVRRGDGSYSMNVTPDSINQHKRPIGDQFLINNNISFKTPISKASFVPLKMSEIPSNSVRKAFRNPVEFSEETPNKRRRFDSPTKLKFGE